MAVAALVAATRAWAPSLLSCLQYANLRLLKLYLVVQSVREGKLCVLFALAFVCSDNAAAGSASSASLL